MMDFFGLLSYSCFRMFGYLPSVFEASSLQAFKKGRMEHIRTVTKESAEFIKASNDKSYKVGLVCLQSFVSNQIKLVMWVQCHVCWYMNITNSNIKMIKRLLPPVQTHNQRVIERVGKWTPFSSPTIPPKENFAQLKS